MNYQKSIFVGLGRPVFSPFSFVVSAMLFCLSALAGSVTLQWSPSMTSGVASYNVYYGGASGAYTNKVSGITTTNATVTGLVNGVTYYFAVTTFNTSGVESKDSAEISYLVPAVAVNQAPTLNAIGNVSVGENAGLQTVSLSGITSGATNENQTLTVSAVSGNPALIPNPTVNYTSPNATGSLSFTPVANTTGTATVTVTVNDGGASNNIVTETFTVTVNSVNQAPTLNSVANVTVNENAGLQTVSLSGITSGAASPLQTLMITATSSSPGLIPSPTVTYISPNSTGSLSFTPAANNYGTATITVTVNNGGTSNNIVTKTFTVTVNQVIQPPTLDSISNVSLSENTGQQTVSLDGISLGTATGSQPLASQPTTLTITAASSNPGLIPNPKVVYTSPNPVGSLVITPVPNQYGSATITVTVNNGAPTNNIASKSFVVKINQVNQPPTLDALNDLTLIQGCITQTVSLTGITSGLTNPTPRLTLTATSNNRGVAWRTLISYVSPGQSGTLNLKFIANCLGMAKVTVTVNNGQKTNNTVSRSFNVTLLPKGSSAPRFVSKPANQMALAGQTVTLNAAASGAGPMTYQWLYNSAPIPYATNAVLTLVNVSTNQSGQYVANVSNILGTTNVAVTLTVYPSVASSLVKVAAPVAGQYAMAVSGVPGYKYVVQASTDLVNWISVQTNTSPFTFVDTNASQFSQQFYRTMYQP